MKNSSMKVIVFDLYETLITNLRPNYQQPVRSIASRLGLEDTQFRSVWKSLNRQRMTGKLKNYPEALKEICMILGVAPYVQKYQTAL